MPTPNSRLADLEPREVFARFAEIAAIPRCSSREQAISDYLVAFAEKRGLEAVRDAALNVLIRKPGANGGENAPGVIIQAHTDMVCIKEPGLAFDFTREGVRPQVDGDTLRASGTTLGADNGIGVAYALALLDARDVPHPPLEAVFTTGEETGMDGAKAFDAAQLRGAYFINADSEDEGVFYASCCGGARLRIVMPLATVPVADIPGDAARAFYRIEVGGLRGGHSGVDIDKERGNANRLMARILRDLDAAYEVHLCDLAGGHVDNAIPDSASAVIFARLADEAALRQRLADLEAVFRNELKAADGLPGPDGRVHVVDVCFAEAPRVDAAFSPEAKRLALLVAMLIPNGVAAMDLNNPAQTLVETSSNFAIVGREANELVFTVSVRSSLESKKAFLAGQLECIAGVVGGRLELKSAYPGWEYDPDSELRQIFIKAYEKVRPGETPKVMGIHAGLECGIFADHFKRAGRKVDFISLGPDIRGAHTPGEALDIPSTRRTWDLLKEALALICG